MANVDLRRITGCGRESRSCRGKHEKSSSCRKSGRASSSRQESVRGFALGHFDPELGAATGIAHAQLPPMFFSMMFFAMKSPIPVPLSGPFVVK